jgi:hypothetical protein
MRIGLYYPDYYVPVGDDQDVRAIASNLVTLGHEVFVFSMYSHKILQGYRQVAYRYLLINLYIAGGTQEIICSLLF